MTKYHIRFNHQHTGPENIWRVIDSKQEHLVKGLRISVDLFDEQTIENGITKWNVCCIGSMQIVDGIAFIRKLNETEL